MPTVFLPGIGATMRTLGTLRLRARSSARVVILLSAQAGFQGDLVLRDDRAGVDADHADVELEIVERLLQQRGQLAQLLIVLLEGERLRIFEQRQRRQLEVFVVAFLSRGRNRRGHGPRDGQDDSGRSGGGGRFLDSLDDGGRSLGHWKRGRAMDRNAFQQRFLRALSADKQRAGQTEQTSA